MQVKRPIRATNEHRTATLEFRILPAFLFLLVLIGATNGVAGT